MELWHQFVELADGFKLSLLIALIFANLLTGVAASIYTKTFRLGYLANFLYTRILPYLIGYLAVVGVALVSPEWVVAVTVIWSIILVALVGNIFANFKEMGIKLPDTLAGKK